MLKSDAAEKACVYLTSVLGTNPLLLTELDLSGKKPGDSGVKQFCALLEDSHCKLKKLKLVGLFFISMFFFNLGMKNILDVTREEDFPLCLI